MKRSDMVKYLHKLLETYVVDTFDECHADEILEGLEIRGMAPPHFMKEVPISIIDKVNQKDKTVTVLKVGQEWRGVHEWETE